MKLPKSHPISAKMLLIGAGKMGKLVFKHLASKGCRKIVVVQAPVEVHIPWCMKYHDIFWVIASLGDGAWNALLALGNIAFAYTSADVLIEIQNTLKSPPAENKIMKKATFYGIGLTTIFYLTLECTEYTAFGNNAPGNILTGFGFYEPFWLVDIANICIIVHLLGAYNVKVGYFRSLSKF